MDATNSPASLEVRQPSAWSRQMQVTRTEDHLACWEFSLRVERDKLPTV